MDPVVADLNPKTIENAKRQFVEVYGSALVMNTYLKLALLLTSLLALGLLFLNFRTQAAAANVRPLVVRIDEAAGIFGKAEREKAEEVLRVLVPGEAQGGGRRGGPVRLRQTHRLRSRASP